MNTDNSISSVGSSLKPQHVHVIVNPAAGRPLPLLAILNAAFKSEGVDWDVFITKESGDARRLAQQALKAGVDLVVACGGDGTVMEVADGLVGSGMPMAILPAGTANVMALELGISLDLNQAAALIASGNNQIREVDMGAINDRRFLLRVGIGAEAQITIGTDRQVKNRLGTLAYVLTAVSALSNPPVSWFTMDLDGLHVEVEGITCMIANSGNVGIAGVQIAPDIHIDDGLLDIVVVRRGDLPSLLAVATAAMLESAQEPEPLLRWQVREAKIMVQPSMPIIADGEVLEPGPVTARILPKSVRILCPPPQAPVEGLID
jgi:YegS/Rv2252/BmrU family lipid kinase